MGTSGFCLNCVIRLGLSISVVLSNAFSLTADIFNINTLLYCTTEAYVELFRIYTSWWAIKIKCYDVTITGYNRKYAFTSLNSWQEGLRVTDPKRLEGFPSGVPCRSFSAALHEAFVRIARLAHCQTSLNCLNPLVDYTHRKYLLSLILIARTNIIKFC